MISDFFEIGGKFQKMPRVEPLEKRKEIKGGFHFQKEELILLIIMTLI